MKLLALLLFPLCAFGQVSIPEPTGVFYGVVLSDNFRKGGLSIPGGMQMDLSRTDLTVSPDVNAIFAREQVLTNCNGEGNSACYGLISYGVNHGAGLLNGDYIRVHGDEGSGPTIAHKTAVRGSSSQWANWAEQINLGPGAKAAFWIGGDNPLLEGKTAHVVPNVMVIAGDLDVQNAVIQWNASAGSTGDLLRIFQAGRIVFRVTADGVVMARGYAPL